MSPTTPPRNPNAAAAVPEDNETTAELDAGAVARGWERLKAEQQRVGEPRRPRKHAVVSWGARSDIGRVRENNEDKFDFFAPEDAATLASHGRLWAVADGMGGHNAGQIASEAALKAIVRAYFGEASFDDVAGRLRAALGAANTLIHQAASRVGDRSGMGTTVTAAVVHEDRLIIAHIGDSRAYLLRAGQLRQLTEDHSWVEEQVRRGGITRAEAEASPYRNVITRSIGMAPTATADIVEEPLEAGDIVLLCSDGLTGYLDGQPLAERLAAAVNNPSEAALALTDAANDAGGKDNITTLILAIRSIEPYTAAASGGAAASGTTAAR